ncbi:CAAX farnesyltransferase (FTase) subunit beta [Recurvomyces mirabilis]|nr:CAAX farnesyltransferase (FTase) subunit beta [Recurvomyces mirabilis]
MATRDSAADDTLDELLRNKARIVELPDDNNEDEFTGVPFPGNHLRTNGTPHLPQWLQQVTIGLFHDDYKTVSSEALDKTAAECLPHLTGKDNQGIPLNRHGLPHLRRKQHASFLHTPLKGLPAPPWLFYWCTAGLSFLGEDVSMYRERLVETVRPLQNKTGGFGGGHGQLSHCACTYATLLALATVGGLDVIDCKAMWHWLGTVKQVDGGFRMAIGAEEDIRGAYCAMTAITLLNLPLELPPDSPAREAGLTHFTDKLGEWISTCQSYEGGISSAPNHEVHGAYAFCALACLCILGPPHITIPKYLDVDRLIHCLTTLQTNPEGGFAGRTNKLVDACYSHWVGGCWALLEAAVVGPYESKQNGSVSSADGRLWNREALVRYLLTCCQQPGPKGGMRDKPSARPDGYHTCYSLSGLSAAQNHYIYDTAAATTDRATGRLLSAFNWNGSHASTDGMRQLSVERDDVVELVHPVFVIRFEAVEEARKKFAGGGFPDGEGID